MSWKELIYRFVIDLFSMSPANATTTVHMLRPRCTCHNHGAHATATVPMPWPPCQCYGHGANACHNHRANATAQVLQEASHTGHGERQEQLALGF